MNNQNLNICMNPNCPQPTKRSFYPQLLASHKKCINWIVNQSTLDRIESSKLSYDYPVRVDFVNQGLESILKISKLAEWPIQLGRLFQQFKGAIILQIDKLKQQKIQEFFTVCNQTQKAYIQIKQIFNNSSIQGFQLQGSQIYKLLYLPSLNLFGLKKSINFYEKQIKQSLKIFANLAQSCGQNYDEAIERKRRVMLQKTKQFFFQNSSVTINQKLQKIATNLKKEMVKTSFDSKLSLFKTNCWFCDQFCYSPKKDPTKNGCMQNLLLHFSECHVNQVFLTYMTKHLKYEAEQINYFKFIEKIRFEQIEQVYVIDRQNAGLIQKPIQLGQKKLWIEVMNKDNRKLAKASYIVAGSNRKDSADIMMTILIYQMLKYKVGRIILVTKDHFGQVLVQIMQNFFPSRIQCIQPKNLPSKLQGVNNMSIQ